MLRWTKSWLAESSNVKYAGKSKAIYIGDGGDIG